jgi:uncharacterized membrane protein YraQ (UPF0718 family)
MSTVPLTAPRPDRSRSPRAVLIGAAVLALVALLGLTWAKWSPYLDRARTISSSGDYPGKDVLAKAGEPGSAPSLSGAWDFAVAYGTAIWPALVVALVLGAGIEALLPRRWIARAFGAEGPRGSLAGGVGALPTMMCSCCAAPVTVSMRRRGASTAASLAFWVGNPLLNPAVLVFLALLLPWPWVTTRAVVGIVVVFGLTALVARFAPRSARAAALERTREPEPAEDEDGVAARFGRALLRFGAILIPEYVVLVLLLGLFRGWVFPIDGALGEPAVLVIVLAAVVGTLVVLPTGGEIPLLIGLSAAGVGAGVLGALLVTLPAVSAVSMVLVGRTLGGRVTLAMGGAVAASGLAGAALLAGLGG